MPPSALGCFAVRVEIAASLYRNTISGPHDRIVGNGECSIRFTVASRVSDQPSIAPSGVSDHRCARMRAAISLCPEISKLARGVRVTSVMSCRDNTRATILRDQQEWHPYLVGS